MRALRPDKLTVAALEATLALHRDPAAARERIPTIRMLSTPPDELRRRAEHLAREIGGDVVPTVGRVGGGSLPLAEIPSYAVALPAPDGEDSAAATLRGLDPSVVARVYDGRVLLDVLTMSPSELAELALMLGRR
jgi:L-seryl-tRNA(Ser) seleniumtransferase